MKKYLITSLLILMILSYGFSQSLENNVNIIYMKANVLFDSGRFDESVRLYNQVLQLDENYLQAYIMRAKAKYQLGAYRGTKNDLNSYVEKAGITKETIRLMSITELKLKNFLAAKNYLEIFLELDPFDAEIYRYAGEAHLQLENKNQACEHWMRGANLGDKESSDYSREYCDIYLRKLKELSSPGIDTIISDSIATLAEMADNMEFTSDDDKFISQDLEINDDLTITLNNGLGTRRVDAIPEIFMLSGQSGEVVIHICVDSTGKVITSEFNKDGSSIFQTGIVSLAIRKSREFQFFPSFTDEQCGDMIYKISSNQ